MPTLDYGITLLQLLNKIKRYSSWTNDTWYIIAYNKMHIILYGLQLESTHSYVVEFRQKVCLFQQLNFLQCNDAGNDFS